MKILISLFSVIILGFAIDASAYVASSSNYRLDKDSINVGGLDISSSTNYSIADTIGETGTGTSTSANYSMQAGYRQMDEVSISMSAPSSITMSPSIVAGETATGSGTWTVNTDASAGYILDIKASTDPAMQYGANSFSDYTPASSGIPDYDWSIASANSEFGFSPYNASSQVDKFKNDSSSCATGSTVTSGKCWYGFSTTEETVVDRSSSTSVSGEETVINFQAEILSSGTQVAGDYSATIIVTATSN